MAPMILSDDLYGELEDLVLHTPLAKERCRAQASVLRLAEGPPAEQVADTFQVSRQTVYNWAERFRQRRRARPPGTPPRTAPRLGHPPLDLRDHRPLDRGGIGSRSTRVGLSVHGLDRRTAGALPGASPWNRGLPQERELGDHTPPSPLETAPTSVGVAARNPAHKQKGAKTRPQGSLAPHRAVDAGRNNCHGDASAVFLLWSHRRASPESADNRGTHNKRVLHGAINIRSSDLALLITEDWTQDSHEAFLRLIRAHWRGWNLVLFEDRASQHKAARAWAQEECLKIETRLLPKATPELNAMDHLWRHTKRVTLGQSSDALDRRLGSGHLSVPDRLEPS